MKEVKKFAFDIGWVFISSVVTLIISFLLSIVLARWLGASDLGLYRMVITIQGIGALITTFGIPVAVIKYVAEYKNDEDTLTQTLFSALVSSIIFGIGVFFLLYMLSGALASVFKMPELARLIKILSLVFPFTSILETLLGLLNGIRKIKKFAFLMILRQLLMILFIVAFVKIGYGINGAVWGIVLSAAGGCLVGIFITRNFLHLKPYYFVQNAKKLISFGSKVFGANTLALILTQADIIILGYFLTAKDVGYYSIAVTLSNFFLLVPRAILRITYPATSEYWSQKNHQKLQKMIEKSVKYSACILIPAGLGAAFFCNEIISTLFGKEFIYAALPFYVLLIARVINGSIELPIGGSLSGIGRPDLPLKIDIVSAVTNIGLNIILIPHYGILGAAIATAISLMMATSLSLTFIIRILAVKIDFKWYMRAAVYTLVAIIPFLLGKNLVNPFIVGIIILCIYVVLIYLIFLTKDDKSLIMSLAYSLIFRK
ncbi:MAG: flippase [Candidatus Aminicenantaceae bacterium]